MGQAGFIQEVGSGGPAHGSAQFNVVIETAQASLL